jgi:hypothetical protein
VHKLANGGIQAKPVHVRSSKGENHFHGRTVDNVPGANTVGSGPEQIFGTTVTTGFAFIDAEDGTYGYVAVNVARSVERIKGNAVLSSLAGRYNDGLLVFFGNKDAADTGVDESVNHHVVR